MEAWARIAQQQDEFLAAEKARKEAEALEIERQKVETERLSKMYAPMTWREWVMADRYCPMKPWQYYAWVRVQARRLRNRAYALAAKRRAAWRKWALKRHTREAMRLLDLEIKISRVDGWGVKKEAPKPAVATSVKQVVKKWNRVSEDLTRLVDSFEPKERKERNALLLCKLQGMIAYMAGQRLPQYARVAFNERWALRFMEDYVPSVEPQMADEQVRNDEETARLVHLIDNGMNTAATLRNYPEMDNYCQDVINRFIVYRNEPVKYSCELLELRAEVDRKMQNVISAEHDKLRTMKESQPEGNVVKSMKRTQDKVEKAADTVTGGFGSLMDKAKDIWADMKKRLGKFGEFFTYDRLVCVLSQVGHMLISPCTATIAMGIGTIILTLIGASFGYLADLACTIGNWLKGCFSKKSTKKNTAEAQSDDSDGSLEVIGTLLTILSGAACYAFSPDANCLRNLRSMFWDFSLLGRGLTGVVTIVKHLFHLVEKLWNWLRIKIYYGRDPSYRLHDSPKPVITWARVSERILHPDVESKYSDFPDYVDLLEKAYLQGTYYVSLMRKSKFKLDCQVYIGKLVDRLRLKRDEMVNAGKFPFTRVVPFSIHLASRQTGIGKSTMVPQSINRLLRAANIRPMGNAYYKIEPANDHWDACRNEPAILIDDAWNVVESQSEVRQLGVYFNLISNAPYTPPMAALESKKMRINPVLLWANSNVLYPKPNSVKCNEALWRRRDVVIETRVRATHMKNYRGGKIDIAQYDQKQRDEYVWLEFDILDDPTNEESPRKFTQIAYDDVMKMLENWMREHHKEQLKRITAEMHNRIADFKEMGNKTVSEMIDDIYRDVKKKAKPDDLPKNKLLDNLLWTVEDDNLEFVEPQGDYDEEIKYLLDQVKDVSPNENTAEIQAMMEASGLKWSPSTKIMGCTDFEYSKDFIDKIVDNSFKDEDISKVGQLLKCFQLNDRSCKHRICKCIQVIKHEGNHYIAYRCGTERCPKELKRYECIETCVLNRGVLQGFGYEPFAMDPVRFMLLGKVIQERYMVRSLKLSKRKVKSRVKRVALAIGKILKVAAIVLIPAIVALVGFVALRDMAHGAGVWEAVKGAPSKILCMESYRAGMEAQAAVYAGAEKTTGPGRVAVKSMLPPRLQPETDIQPIDKDIEKALMNEKSQYISDCIRLITRNTYMLVAQYDILGTTYTVHARGIFIRGQQFLTVRHCWDEIKARCENRNGKLRLVQSPSFQKELMLEKIRVQRYSNSNYVLLTIEGMPFQRDITNMVATARSHNYTTLRGRLVEIGLDRKITDVKLDWETKSVVVAATPNSIDVPMISSYMYNYGGKGVCGSILICPDSNPCIIGMHVAGMDSVIGYSEPIFQEMFKVVPVKGRIVDVVLPRVKEIAFEEAVLDGNFITLGLVDAQYARFESGKSSIVPSLCHGIFEVMTEPAPLSRSDPRLPPGTDPMILGVNKHGKPIRGFPSDLIKFGFESLRSIVRVRVKPLIKVTPTSLEEAILGRAGIGGFASINMHSSEGFPLSALKPPGVTGKKYLFDCDLDKKELYGIDENLKTIMSIKDGLRKKGKVPFTVFTDCLKDARIAKEKCRIPGKTRIFSVSPVDFSIQFRQYFLPYTVAHQNSRWDFSSAVGINVNGVEWSVLVGKMIRFSPYQLCGDYSNFGAGFDEEVHRMVGEILIDWFKFNGDDSEENETIRRVMLHELVYPWHLCKDILYQTVSGMPSGSPITVETNDLVNLYYILMMWFDIMRPLKLHTLKKFEKYVRVKTYGDDIWMAVHPDVIEYFNNMTISKAFAQYGVEYTDADKKGMDKPYRSWEEVSFLKRTPKVHPTRLNHFLAALDLNSTLDIANWCYESNDMAVSTLVNLEACSDMMYGHGPEKHQEIKNILELEANKLGHVGNFRSWETMDDIFLEPQMEDDQGVEGHGSATRDTKEGVTIIDHRDISRETGPEDEIAVSWNNLTCSEKLDRDCGPEHRWLPIANFKWTTADALMECILKYGDADGMAIPNHGLAKNLSTPMAMKFKQHRYWRGTVVLKLVVNTNKFMTGQLQMSFFYGERYDGTNVYRDNRQCISQMLHGRLQAGSSNSIELRVPFVYMYPYMSTAYRPYDLSVMNVGRVYVHVFNQLAASSASYKAVSCQLFMAIEESHFCGLVDMSLGYLHPDMDLMGAAAVSLAESYLRQYIPDANRDMPVVPMIPNPVAIIGNGNLSYGTGSTEPMHVMRLDPRGQTPYAGISGAEMNIHEVITIFGYCKTFKWADEKTGTCLLSIPAGPIWNLKAMDEYKFNDHIYYSLSPLAFVCNLFKQWRGTIEYRFDFVANDFYTGTVAVVFIPGVQKDPGWEVAKCCSYTTFDLREERSFTFTVPYVTDRIWWPRPLGLDKRNEYFYPGTVCMYVINPMGLMDNIPSSIEINIYQRAGCDFEVSVPVQPAISTALYQQYSPYSPTELFARDGYFPYYVGTSRYFQGGTKAIMRWGATFDHIALFDEVTIYCYYHYKGPDTVYFQEKQGDNWIEGTVRVEWAIVWLDEDNAVYWLIPIKSEKDAKQCILNRYAKKSYTDLLVDCPNNDKGKYMAQNNEHWERFLVTKPHLPHDSDSDYSIVSAEIGERDNPGMTVDNKGCLPSTSSGLMTFGEKFSSFTDLLRRYQFYYKTSFQADMEGLCSSVVVRPYGMLPFSNSTDKRQLYAREGMHALISCGYKYFRGGVRLKLICLAETTAPVVLYVQHRPDVVDYLEDRQTAQDAQLGQGYATHIQNITLNPVMCIEIPFYLDSVFGNIAHNLRDENKDPDRLAHLGRLYISAKCAKKVNITVEIYMALADDAKYTLFQGFLPVRFITDVLQ
nr:polyprotein [Diaphorina citri picorna-like virus]